MKGEQWSRYECNRLKILHGVISVGEIAKLLGRSYDSVRYKVRAMGLEADKANSPAGQRFTYTKFTDKQSQMVASLLDEGFTVKEVYVELFSEDEEVSLSTVRECVQRIRGTEVAGELWDV